MAREAVWVLIVDDLPSFRVAAAATVAVSAGFALAGLASSGDEALGVLAQTPVDLVLMDVHMPGDDGTVVAERMISRHPELVVVLLSVDRAPKIREAAERSGVRFVAKAEFGPETLEAIWSSRISEA